MEAIPPGDVKEVSCQDSFSSVSDDYSKVLLSVSPNSTVVQEQRTLNLDSNVSVHRLHNIPYKGVEQSNINIISKKDLSTSVTRQVIHKPLANDAIDYLKQCYSKQVSLQRGETAIVGLLKKVTKDEIVIEDEGNARTYYWKDPTFLFLRVIDDSSQVNNTQLAYIDVTVKAETLGEQVLTLMYTSSCIFWYAEYEMRLNTQSHVLELFGNFVIVNQSSKEYKSPDIRLLLPQRTISSRFTAHQEESNFSSNFFNSSSFPTNDNGVTYAPNNVFHIPNCPDIEARSVIKVPITTTHLPFESLFWLDANFEFHQKDSLNVDEHRSSKKKTSKLFEVISFKNTSKKNLPPGSVKMYFVKDYHSKKKLEELREPPIAEDQNVFFHPVHNLYSSSFNGCYLDQVAIIPIQRSEAVACNKERRSFKYEERTRKVTESFLITITNFMKTSDILVQDSFHRSKKWTLSNVIPDQYEIVDSNTVSWSIPQLATGRSVEIKYTVTYTWGSADEIQSMQVVEDSNIFEEVGEEEVKSSLSRGLFSKFLGSSSKKK